MIKKFYQLQKGDKANYDGKLYTFIGIDGMYARWMDENGEIGIGHDDTYELKEDGLWYPVIK